MSRQEFLSRLKQALYGLPQPRIDDILADYQSHFDEGVAAGRSEAEVAAALGEPSRLAKELRAEAHIERWKEDKSPSAGVAAVFALIGLIALDWFFLLPILFVLFLVLAVMTIVSLALMFGGLAATIGGMISTIGPDFNGAALLGGLAAGAGGVSLMALTLLIAAGSIKLLIRWARLHAQVVTPKAA